ncbi:MAG: alpha/beta fold hydrolase [Sporichthyaceae bacterium]
MRFPRSRTFATAAALAGLLAAPSLAHGSAAQAAEGGVVSIPVEFKVKNTNRTPVVCSTPVDGKEYTIRGNIVALESVLKNAKAATLYLHAVTQGEFYWNLPVEGYDHVNQMAKKGHVSVTINRLGYGNSDKPPGLESCFGSQADTSNQVLAALKSGEYTAKSGTAPKFDKVFVAGHSAGGLTATIMAYAFDDAAGLINYGWNDQPSAAFTFTEAFDTNGRCLRSAAGQFETTPKNYTPFGTDKERILFHSAPKEVRAASPAPAPDPCGDLLSFQDGIAANARGVASTTIPVLIIGGANDSLFPPPGMEIQAKRYTSSSSVTFKEFAETGHGFGYEASAKDQRELVSEWLKARA